METDISEFFEEREEFLEMGKASGKIDPIEEKKIRQSLTRLRARWNKYKENGTLTVSGERNLRKELAHIYRMIFFYSRKDKVFTYSRFGKKFYLKEPWQTRYQRVTLSKRDMEEIMTIFNMISRKSSQLKHSSAFSSTSRDAEESASKLSAESEKMLLKKYFTLEKPIEKNLQKGRNKTKKKITEKTSNGNKQPKTT